VAREVLRQRGHLALELGLELGVGGLGEQLDQLLDGPGPCLEAAPGVDLVAEALGLPQDRLGVALVVPEAGCLRADIELGDAPFGGLEVKDAPTST
jgi:hypothetical protein